MTGMLRIDKGLDAKSKLKDENRIFAFTAIHL